MVPSPNAGIALRDLHVPAYNPRRFMSEIEYAELMASIKAQGILQPILARFVAGKKDEFIKQITSVAGFEYQGKLPNVLKPDFEK